MSPEDLALFPFLTASSQYVEELDFSLVSLLSERAFHDARRLGFSRVAESMNGEISKPASFGSDRDILNELLSYPYARILVSCVSEPALIRKYALSEAKAAYEVLRKSAEKNPEFLIEVGEDFGISANDDGSRVHIYFSDYIRYSLSLKDISWKMVNRHLSNGFVTIHRDEFARLLQEAVRKKIEHSLPVPNIPDEIQEQCASYVSDLKQQYELKRKDMGETDFGEVDFNIFPPCISKSISDVKSGVNLAHSMRFALVSFLLNIGMAADDVVQLFNISPDFSEEKTRYQVEHIAGNEYKTPSCATMITYGNCVNKDKVCEKINHPLGYYQRKVFFKRKDEEALADTIRDETGSAKSLNEKDSSESH
ncbi:DNA primase regulatory subunit PriL [Methanolapillus millepedarum]|uniref:DNA primase large subunit PriL n=1 Tax=Methanolapillus millepedarum TaxID=3028296 RepID=A0AA97A3T1_9EURY|nr:hypothetical protein MsAc7_08290 [Methanosarcinaceae archaeon Ac7]